MHERFCFRGKRRTTAVHSFAKETLRFNKISRVLAREREKPENNKERSTRVVNDSSKSKGKSDNRKEVSMAHSKTGYLLRCGRNERDAYAVQRDASG